MSTGWYGLQIADTSLSDDDVISVAAFIQSDDVSRIFGYTTQNTGVLDLDNENDIASKLKTPNTVALSFSIPARARMPGVHLRACVYREFPR